MLKKRVIFTLLLENNNFVLSRNFRLQSFGNIHWLLKKYNFKKIAFCIDEIIILNVSRNNKNFKTLIKYLKELNKICFIPICAGGNINKFEEVKTILKSGADKVVLNSSLFTNPKLIEKIYKSYGQQSIVASIDVMKKDSEYKVFINKGSSEIPYNLKTWLLKLSKSNIGEIYINSIDKDGTGNGYDFEILKHIPKFFDIPVIIAGGAGNYNHFFKGLKNKKIDAVSTANLVNFVGDGLINARKELLKKNVKLAIRNE